MPINSVGGLSILLSWSRARDARRQGKCKQCRRRNPRPARPLQWPRGAIPSGALSSATSLRHRCDSAATSLRHRSDVAATQRCDIAATSLRHRCDSAATSLRHRSDVAATQRCDTALRHRSDVAATNARRSSEIAETSPRRRGGMYIQRYTISALEKRMRTRKPRPIFFYRPPQN